MAPRTGLEPVTSTLTVLRSDQLDYRGIYTRRFEKIVTALPTELLVQWTKRDSNS